MICFSVKIYLNAINCLDQFVFLSVFSGEVDDIDSSLRKENVLNNPLLEDGTFLYMATKVC